MEPNRAWIIEQLPRTVAPKARKGGGGLEWGYSQLMMAIFANVHIQNGCFLYNIPSCNMPYCEYNISIETNHYSDMVLWKQNCPAGVIGRKRNVCSSSESDRTWMVNLPDVNTSTWEIVR